MLSKRKVTSSDKDNIKKFKTVNSSNYFISYLKECGLDIKRPPEKCIAYLETINIVKKINQNLVDVSEFFSCFKKECQELDVFKHYLFPNIILSKENSDSPDEHLISDSVIRILLNVTTLQSIIIDYVFEKATDLAVQSKCGPWIQMILKCFTTLDNILSTNKMSTILVNLLEISTEKMVKIEIISAMHLIIHDEEHENVATELSRFLSEDHELIPAVLNCLSYLWLSDDQYEQLHKKILNILMTLIKICYYPNFVTFLLKPGRISDAGYLETVQGLRKALRWSTSNANLGEIATSQVLTASAIRSTIISSKSIASAWMKVVSSCKIPTDHNSLDFVIALLFYTASEERQKEIENLLRKHIKLSLLEEDLLQEAFEKYKPILREYIQQLIELTNSLLKLKTDPLIESFASHIYILMFSELEECRQIIVAELLQLGLDHKQCIMSILTILNKIAAKNIDMLKPQSLQMLNLLDRTNDITLHEIRQILNLLCALAYTFDDSIITDNMNIIIRKQLSSSSPSVKIQGILGGVYAIKYLMASTKEDDNPSDNNTLDDISTMSITHLPEGKLKEAAQLIELIACCTKQFPDMTAFFYDELSTVISIASHINRRLLTWLNEACTKDFTDTFVIECTQVSEIDQMQLSLQYCLNSEGDVDDPIAVNIAGVTLNPKNDVNIGIISPLFQLVQTLHSKLNNGDLSAINALLGCPIVLPQFDIDTIEELEQITVHNILDCLIHCVNWFRELLNAFAMQDDENLKEIISNRIMQIEDIEYLISKILFKNNATYKPPFCNYNVSKYIGEHKAKQNKVSTIKKNAMEDTVLPQTAKTQASQSNATKNKINIIESIPYRNLNLNLLKLFNSNLYSYSSTTGSLLNLKIFKFLLKSVNRNMESVLISGIKRNPFLSKRENSIYDADKAEECVKNINDVLPKLISLMKFITQYLDTNINETTENESSLIYSSAIIDHLTCLEYLFCMLYIYFKWIGFRKHNNSLLTKSLQSIVSTFESNSRLSLNKLLLSVANIFQLHEKYCLQLTTAVSLIELLKSIESLSDSSTIQKALKKMASKFLSMQWKTPDGGLEKGLHFNRSIDKITQIYLLNIEIIELKNLVIILTTEIQNLKSRDNVLHTMKCFNKATFPILYRSIGTAIYEASKTCLKKAMTDLEHLTFWKDVVIIMTHMTAMAKTTIENRNILMAFFKKSLPILKLFLSQGVPILELRLKNETEEVVEILKLLQITTRFLQVLCNHSRLNKDKSLMAKVPSMKKTLETLIYKVKAALVANNCTQAFSLGTLRNKNIYSENVNIQQSTEEDCDDQLPDDCDSDDTDDELLNPDPSVSDRI